MAAKGISGPLNSLLFLISPSGPDFERVQNAAGISLTVAMPCGASFSARQRPLRLIAPLSVWQVMQQCSQWRVLYFIEFIDRATLPAAPGAALRPRHHSPEEQAALLAEVQAP